MKNRLIIFLVLISVIFSFNSCKLANTEEFTEEDKLCGLLFYYQIRESYENPEIGAPLNLKIKGKFDSNGKIEFEELGRCYYVITDFDMITNKDGTISSSSTTIDNSSVIGNRGIKFNDLDNSYSLELSGTLFVSPRSPGVSRLISMYPIYKTSNGEYYALTEGILAQPAEKGITTTLSYANQYSSTETNQEFSQTITGNVETVDELVALTVNEYNINNELIRITGLPRKSENYDFQTLEDTTYLILEETVIYSYDSKQKLTHKAIDLDAELEFYMENLPDTYTCNYANEDGIIEPITITFK